MRRIVLAAIAAAAMLPATAVSAQGYGYNQGRGYNQGYGYNQGRGYNQGYGYNQGRGEVGREQRECRRELRHANNRWQYQRELRECRREIAQARRDQYRHHGRNDRYDRDDRRYRGW